MEADERDRESFRSTPRAKGRSAVIKAREAREGRRSGAPQARRGGARSAQGARMCEAMHCFFPIDEMLAVALERLSGGAYPRSKGILIAPTGATAAALDTALRGAGGGVKSAAVQPLEAVPPP